MILFPPENSNVPLNIALQGPPEAFNKHLSLFSSFFVSSTRDASESFQGYLRGLFQSTRGNMLRMSEVNQVDHQAMQHMLTDGVVDWDGHHDFLIENQLT